ncbi:MAG TPA: hypothetical protein VLK78_01770, partial [Candidatus Angelobacter sp.]|nr:hypothetical protein [Candidatus Angelobacter sp.]
KGFANSHWQSLFSHTVFSQTIDNPKRAKKQVHAGDPYFWCHEFEEDFQCHSKETGFFYGQFPRQ